ncbi:uncharacterized protein LOC109616123 [Esox lucius]|uniref:uncharacterized protein LOC109616123 n=1 Tax=Esox lucius TaxID=8010 RepID=UPI001476CB86|nr:uncharacterized protein LOC109616123 [Esox lucius]
MHLNVGDAPHIPTPSIVNSSSIVTRTLPNISATSSNIPRTISKLSAAFSKFSTELIRSEDISAPSSLTPGLTVWTSVGLVVMVTVVGLVPLLFYRKRGVRRQTNPPQTTQHMNSPPNMDEADYGEINEAEIQTDPNPLFISPVYSTVNKQTTTTTYPDGRPSTTYPAGRPSTTYPAGRPSTTYPAGRPSTTYPGDGSFPEHPGCSTHFLDCLNYIDIPKDSGVSSIPPTAGGTQDVSVYSTVQFPKDNVKHKRSPDVHISKDIMKEAIYSTVQQRKML